jgi:hypothetical protein
MSVSGNDASLHKRFWSMLVLECLQDSSRRVLSVFSFGLRLDSGSKE